MDTYNRKLSIKLQGFGYIVVSAQNFDKLMNKLLPNSPKLLKDRIRRQRAKNGLALSDKEAEFSLIASLTTVTECLMVLAKYEELAE